MNAGMDMRGGHAAVLPDAGNGGFQSSLSLSLVQGDEIATDWQFTARGWGYMQAREEIREFAPIIPHMRRKYEAHFSR